MIFTGAHGRRKAEHDHLRNQEKLRQFRNANRESRYKHLANRHDWNDSNYDGYYNRENSPLLKSPNRRGSREDTGQQLHQKTRARSITRRRGAVKQPRYIFYK
ncbi:uncharacterized protein LOC119657176 [Hermetia illucens]|uniref:uncharacterized protein LOC119657176 n=1 Tax=Hermetia illucens TaxID=343691 RepID=UPI0018CC4E1A|nr:uncharacterized protein LOC119657176 [Hermetia illucens]